MIQHRKTVGIQTLPDRTEMKQRSAKKLLTYSKRITERTILNELSHLLRLLGITDIESEITVSTGRMDILCHQFRTIIETKKVGKASKEVLSQLEPYIHAKILEDSNELPFKIPEEQNRPWTGIITDGQIWHVWKYRNANNTPSAEKHTLDYRPRTPNDLLEFLSQKIFADKPLGKPRIPQNPYDLFVDDHQKLVKIYGGLKGRSLKETETKFDLWRDMLRASGMEPESKSESQKMFVKHSFLVSVARNVSQILASPEPEKEPHSVLADGFVSWIVQDPDGEDWQKAFLRKINEYDWRRQKGDVLRSVYEGFISSTDRKIFGEYYTPDWLAELLVNETLDPEWLEQSITAANSQLPLKGIGVLDPACGSGTFLYHSAQKILQSDAMKSLHLPLSRQAEIAVRLVNGIDIHPIATEISRATLLRALPAPPPDGTKSINVFQGDSLMTFQDKEDEDRKLLNQMTHEIREKNLVFQIPGTRSKEILIPLSFCESRNFNSEMDRLIAFAKQKKIPQDILESIPEPDRATLEQCCKNFADIISEKGNSVWAWYVTNITAPAFLSRRKVNRIVANPPWVRMGDIQVEYRKRELEQTFLSEGLWQGGKHASNNDIAQLFLKMGRQIYLQNPKTDPASWIVKKSYVKSPQWENFRNWYKDRKIEKYILDLQKIAPFGGGDAKISCVLFDLNSGFKTRKLDQFQKTTILSANKITKRVKILPSIKLNDALNLIEFSSASNKVSKKPSFYQNSKWKSGAATRPQVLVVIDKIEEIFNDPQNAEITTTKSTHVPWRALDAQKGIVPTSYIHKLCKSQDFYPFMISKNISNVIIPTDNQGILEECPVQSSDLWKRLDKIYRKRKGRKSPKTLLGCINYQRKISTQLESMDNLQVQVIYSAAGDHMRSTRYFPSRDNPIILGEGCYFGRFLSDQEAAYIVSILNSPCLENAFVESRRSNRHFHTHIWEYLPIPQFDRQNSDHNRLAELCEEAETAVREWYDSNSEHSTYSQITASKRIRKLLKNNKIFDQIDEIVRRMLPNQATSQQEETSYNP